MRLSFLIFSLSCHHVLQLALADEITLTRHADGDVFTIPGSCMVACMVLSSDTASPYGSAPTTLNGNLNNSCTCQCNYRLPIFREDLGICVDNIQECDVAGFMGSSGLVEKVPYVFLPQYGQIVYPQAEIRFKGVESPVCVVTGVQQLGRSGWSDLRNLSDVQFPLSLYRDEEHTFLQWTGEAKLREIAEGKIVVVKLACRDSYPSTAYRGVFTPCVAFRVAGSPSRGAIKEVLFSTSPPKPQGLSSSEYTAIGVSSVLLALIYIASVSLYLHSRKSRRKDKGERDPEAADRAAEAEPPGLVKCNPLLSVSRHLESDTNSAISEADLADKLLQSESEPEIENVKASLVGNANRLRRDCPQQVTSAVIHPYEECSEPPEQSNSSGQIVGERLPEENVRVIETTENGSQHSAPVFPGTQRRKLYFNPAYFEKQLLAAPPPAAVEFLLKIREVISIAKHKMAAKRFVPTLDEIPEESSAERRSDAAAPASQGKRRASSVHGGAPALSEPERKSRRCAGCPSCSHGSSSPSLPTALSLAESSVGAAPISGESRVRAWLEGVKLLDARWRNLEEERSFAKRYFSQVGRATRAKDRHRHGDADLESAGTSTKSLPPIFSEIRQIGLFASGDGQQRQRQRQQQQHRGPRRSVTHEPGRYERHADESAEWTKRSAREHEESVANAKVRRAIESSFEQLRAAELGERPSAAAEPSADKSAKSSRSESDRQNASPGGQGDTAAPPVKQSKTASGTRAQPGVIGDEPSSRSTSDAKRIMDAVIKELVVAKEKDKDKDKEAPAHKASDYETDSLEKAKVGRRSPGCSDKSSPAQSTALPLDEELTMRNAIIDVRVSGRTSDLLAGLSLPEVVPLRTEQYALVSEVYVNDGYASPAGSDEESGPEIRYEPENPGHLTIKVVDSPENYVKQDESEYEPDTLDRKPMRLRINDDLTYDRDVASEVFVDSLERSSQILLRSKRSFREHEHADDKRSSNLPPEFNSLREIYEARLKYQLQQELGRSPKPRGRQSPQRVGTPGTRAFQQRPSDERESATRNDNREQEKNWRNNGHSCASPLLPRYERRQRRADNQPDVVPKPPPPPPPEPAPLDRLAKNAQDRSFADAGDPTTCKDTPVAKNAPVPVVGKPPAVSCKPQAVGGSTVKTATATEVTNDGAPGGRVGEMEREAKGFDASSPTDMDEGRRNERHQQYRRVCKHRGGLAEESRSSRSPSRRPKSRKKPERPRPSEAPNVEDSAYVSSPESSHSRRRLPLLDGGPSPRGSCSESDESTSGHGANSESGAESIGTDSVFFGNFRARAERERLARAAACHRREKVVEQPSIRYPALDANSTVY